MMEIHKLRGLMMKQVLFDYHAKTMGDLQEKLTSSKESLTQWKWIVKILVKERDELKRSETTLKEALKRA